MKYDFDKITDRKGTDCLKYDFAKERGRHEGILPLWVADMDFPTLPQVSERLRKSLSMEFTATVMLRSRILRHF